MEHLPPPSRARSRPRLLRRRSSACACTTPSLSPASSPPSSLSAISRAASAPVRGRLPNSIGDDDTLAAVAAVALALCAPPASGAAMAGFPPLARACAALAGAAGLSTRGRLARLRALAAAAVGGRIRGVPPRPKDAALRRVTGALSTCGAAPDAAAANALRQSLPARAEGAIAAAAALAALDKALMLLAVSKPGMHTLPRRRSAAAAAAACASAPRDAREMRAWARARIGAVPPYLENGPPRARQAMAAAVRELILVDWHGVAPRVKWLALFAVARAYGDAALCAQAAFSARRAGATPFQLLLATDLVALRATRDHLLASAFPSRSFDQPTTPPAPPPMPPPKQELRLPAAPAHSAPAFDLSLLARRARNESDSEADPDSDTFATVPSWISDEASSTCDSEESEDVPVVDGIDGISSIDDTALYALHEDEDGDTFAYVLSAAFSEREVSILLLAHASTNEDGLSATDASFIRRFLTPAARIEASAAVALAHALHMWCGMLYAMQIPRAAHDALDAPVRRFVQSQLGAQLRLAAVGQRLPGADRAPRRARPHRFPAAAVVPPEFEMYRAALIDDALGALDDNLLRAPLPLR